MKAYATMPIAIQLSRRPLRPSTFFTYGTSLEAFSIMAAIRRNRLSISMRQI
jgi:hypothetical protein